MSQSKIIMAEWNASKETLDNFIRISSLVVLKSRKNLVERIVVVFFFY